MQSEQKRDNRTKLRPGSLERPATVTARMSENPHGTQKRCKTADRSSRRGHMHAQSKKNEGHVEHLSRVHVQRTSRTKDEEDQQAKEGYERTDNNESTSRGSDEDACWAQEHTGTQKREHPHRWEGTENAHETTLHSDHGNENSW